MNGIPWTVQFPVNIKEYYKVEFGMNGIAWNHKE